MAQAFLGTRIGCAQCHNHPLEKYTQDDLLPLRRRSSRRVKLERKDAEGGADRARSVEHRDPNQNKAAGRRPPAAHRRVPASRSRSTARPADVEARRRPARRSWPTWMTDPKNEYFAGAMVNRLWRHFLGVGLVEPVDDLRASNPPTNPALWKALEQRVRRPAGSTCKHLMRLILNSRTYQLVQRDAAGQRDGHALLLALLRPPAAGRGAARRHQPGDRRARHVPRLPASACGRCSCPTRA